MTTKPSLPTDEDSLIWMRLFRTDRGRAALAMYSYDRSLVEMTTWRDQHLMADIERRKAQTAHDVRRLQARGRL